MKHKKMKSLLLASTVILISSSFLILNAADMEDNNLDQIPKKISKNIDEKKINDFIQNLKIYANKGNTKAMIGIGKMHMLYTGDLVKAAEWFKKAEQNNDSDAYCAFGQLYNLMIKHARCYRDENPHLWKGRRPSYDKYRTEVGTSRVAFLSKKMSQSYQKGVDDNNIKAMIALGKITSNSKKAEALLKRAAKTNDSKALIALGQFCEHHLNDEFTAIEYFKKAANLNDIEAINFLIYMYRYGSDRSYEKCFYWLEKAAGLNLSTDELVETIEVVIVHNINIKRMNQIFLNTIKDHEYNKMFKIAEAYDIVGRSSKSEFWLKKATLSEQKYNK